MNASEQCLPKEKLSFIQAYLNRYLNTVCEQSIETSSAQIAEDDECLFHVDPVDPRRLSAEPNSHDYFVYHDCELAKQARSDDDVSSWVIVNESSSEQPKSKNKHQDRSIPEEFVDLDEFDVNRRVLQVEVSLKEFFFLRWFDP